MSVILFIICLIVIFALTMLAFLAVGKTADKENEEIIKEPNPAKTKLVKLDYFEDYLGGDIATVEKEQCN